MLTVKQISTKISSIARRNKTIRADIQSVLIQCAGHAYEHGDVSCVANLLSATQGQDKKAILEFAGEYCFVRVSKDEIKLNKKARAEADFANGDAVIEHLTADAPNWWDSAITTEKAIKALDVAQQLEALAKKIAKSDEVVANQDNINHAFENVIGALQAKLQAKSA